jgi:hypothetical protein
MQNIDVNFSILHSLQILVNNFIEFFLFFPTFIDYISLELEFDI